MTDYTALPRRSPGPTGRRSSRPPARPQSAHRQAASSDGHLVDLGALGPGRTIVYLYPLTGRPGVELPAGWDATPGARVALRAEGR